MVFINKKYGVRSMNGPLSDEAAKMICDLMDEKKEERMTEKKFTEEEYKTITDCFDRLNEKYNMGLLNNSLIREMQDSLFDEFNFIYDWPEIVEIANPATREGAKEKYVEKEKKYVWKYKKLDDEGNTHFLKTVNGIIKLTYRTYYEYFTEKEVVEAGYIPNMFDRKEVD